MNTKKVITYVIIIVLIIFLLNVASSAFYTVQENEYACVVRFSKIIDTVQEAGLYVKIPFIDEVRYFPKTKLFYDLIPSDVLTSDSKAMSVDSFVVWQILNPLKFYQTLGTLTMAENRLDATTYNVLKNVIGGILRDDIISSADEQSRDYLNKAVLAQIQDLVGEYGIEVLDVKVKKFELPTDNEQSVFNRMITDRNRIAELYHAEGNQEAKMI
jgi:membrane protease subunit HflC